MMKMAAGDYSTGKEKLITLTVFTFTLLNRAKEISNKRHFDIFQNLRKRIFGEKSFISKNIY